MGSSKCATVLGGHQLILVNFLRSFGDSSDCRRYLVPSWADHVMPRIGLYAGRVSHRHQVDAAVFVPVKGFDAAKGRLSDTLNPLQRADLAERMAEAVLLAAHNLPVFVICDDSKVAKWARTQGAGVIRPDQPGLNNAATAGLEQAALSGVGRAIIAHADLPLAKDLTALATPDTDVLIVTDHLGDGTNVISLPADALAQGFVFAYGSGSAIRHEAEAHRLGLTVSIIQDPELSWDVDTPADLVVFDTASDLYLFDAPPSKSS